MGRPYETYHGQSYNPAKIEATVQMLIADECVANRKGIFGYAHGGSADPKLLNVRVFDKKVARAAYAKQTQAAKEKDKSNCPQCVVGHVPTESGYTRWTRWTPTM